MEIELRWSLTSGVMALCFFALIELRLGDGLADVDSRLSHAYEKTLLVEMCLYLVLWSGL